MAKFERTGSVIDAPRSGRPKTSEDVAMDVSLAMANDAEHNPHGESSVRTVAKSTGVATMTVEVAEESAEVSPIPHSVYARVKTW